MCGYVPGDALLHAQRVTHWHCGQAEHGSWFENYSDIYMLVSLSYMII